MTILFTDGGFRAALVLMAVFLDWFLNLILFSDPLVTSPGAIKKEYKKRLKKFAKEGLTNVQVIGYWGNIKTTHEAFEKMFAGRF